MVPLMGIKTSVHPEVFSPVLFIVGYEKPTFNLRLYCIVIPCEYILRGAALAEVSPIFLFIAGYLKSCFSLGNKV